MKNTHRGVLLLVNLVKLLKVTLFNGSFPRFLNCTNGTKSHKASHMNKYVGEVSLTEYLAENSIDNNLHLILSIFIIFFISICDRVLS